MGLVPGFEMITLRHWWRSQKARAVGLAEAALGLVGQHAELLTGTEMPFQIRIESVSITRESQPCQTAVSGALQRVVLSMDSMFNNGLSPNLLTPSTNTYTNNSHNPIAAIDLRPV